LSGVRGVSRWRTPTCDSVSGHGGLKGANFAKGESETPG
jgi:hypothetical protein